MNRDPVDQIGNTPGRVVAPNVREFLDRASSLYGRLQADRFGQDMHGHIVEGYLQSPIEDLFWIALRLLCDVYGQAFNPDPDCDENDEAIHALGIQAECQRQIGPYRVDFFTNRHYLGRHDGKWVRDCDQPLIVELDGHDFHDKDKRQRSYEKARDRYLVAHGYRVVHFTGSDVVSDPFRVAYEVLNLLHATDGPYDPQNPAGVE